MRSALRLMPVLVLGVLFSAYALAEDGKSGNSSYPGGIGMENPCNGQVVVVDGTNVAQVRQHAAKNDGDHDRDDRARVRVELRFVGSTTDQTDMGYRTVLKAEGRFENEAPFYDLPYHSEWVSRGAPSFTMDGTIRVFVEAGKATGSSITSFRTSCGVDHDDHDGDHDRH
ncbi:MAG: hypothetical protein JO065_02130 [Acidobacteria bacterium]|nr:hypothetical protein [Acidobacteriota bacterium]